VMLDPFFGADSWACKIKGLGMGGKIGYFGRNRVIAL
jgi:hypothetical protein